jgi:hypothetical protein
MAQSARSDPHTFGITQLAGAYMGQEQVVELFKMISLLALVSRETWPQFPQRHAYSRHDKR